MKKEFTGIFDDEGNKVYVGDKYRDSWGGVSVVKPQCYTDGREITGHGTSERTIEIGYRVSFLPEKFVILKDEETNAKEATI